MSANESNVNQPGQQGDDSEFFHPNEDLLGVQGVVYIPLVVSHAEFHVTNTMMHLRQAKGIFGGLESRPLGEAPKRLDESDFVRPLHNSASRSLGNFSEMSCALDNALMLFGVHDLDRFSVRLGAVTFWIFQRVACTLAVLRLVWRPPQPLAKWPPSEDSF
uniref:Uncharacterized protein n=1 Tax=Solanum tuberosum TaxID=4113 RepID=M1DRQ2_SOLTU